MIRPWFTMVVLTGTALAIRPWWPDPRPVVGTPFRIPRPRPRRGVVVLGLLGVVAVVLAGPVPAVAAGSAATVWWRSRTRRRRERDARQVADVLPEVVDLVLLGVAAGLSPPAALRRTAHLLPAPYHDVLGEVVRRSDRGEPFAVALDRAAVALGPGAQPLVTALTTAGRDGGPVAPALHRVADEARRRRRVSAQARARRLPVTMLLPLVLCVLPAFVLISIVPLVAASVRDLRFGG